MEDLKKTLEKLLTDAEDCDLIGKLATDPLKRDTYLRLAKQLRLSASDLEQTMAQKRAMGE